MKRHAPLITSLAYGPLKLRVRDDAVEEWFVVGGFLEVYQNKVAVLARHIDRVDEIDVDTVRREVEEAEKSDAKIEEFDAARVGRAKMRFAEAWQREKRGY